MIGYQFTLTNRNGLQVKLNDFSSDPINFIALQEYPVFDVDVKNSEINKDGQHGIWDFYSFYGKRVLTFSGVIIGEDEAEIEDLKTQLLQVTSLPSRPTNSNDGMVLVQWTDANNDMWQVYAKLDRAIRFSRPLGQPFRLDFVMTMKSPDPVIRSQTEQTTSGIRTWEQPMLAVPFAVPFSLGLDYHNFINATNGGTFDADTIIRLAGEDERTITNPEIRNLTTGAVFKVGVTLNGSNEWIEIDSQNGTVVDQDGNDVSGLVDSVSNYIKLAVGANVLVYWSSESENLENPLVTDEMPTGIATVKWRDTIL